MELPAAAVRLGFRLKHFERLDSTNTEAMRRAEAGEAEKLWVVAGEQVAGRGRMGRSWVSPPGNLYASLLLRDAAPTALLAQLGFVAGVALIESLSRLAGSDRRLALKWPNDVVFGGAKLAGILLEASSLADGTRACVIGIGVNCASHPSDLAYPATNFACVVPGISAEQVFAALAEHMAQGLAVWDRGRNFAAVRETWLSHAGGLNAPVEVVTGTIRRRGIFRTLDSHGRLMLEEAGAQIAIDAGDVFLAG